MHKIENNARETDKRNRIRETVRNKKKKHTNKTDKRAKTTQNVKTNAKKLFKKTWTDLQLHKDAHCIMNARGYKWTHCTILFIG